MQSRAIDEAAGIEYIKWNENGDEKRKAMSKNSV